jgi:hypothetical protein
MYGVDADPKGHGVCPFVVSFYYSVHLYASNVLFTSRISFWSENESSSRETPCCLSETRPGLSETRPGLSETSNGLSENSPLLSENVINKRTRTVKTKGSLKYFLVAPVFCYDDG